MMKEMRLGFSVLEDQEGNLSSKRLFGAVTLSIGLICHIFLGAFSIFAQAVDPTTASTSFTTAMAVGGGLLGISVLEFLGKGK